MYITKSGNIKYIISYKINVTAMFEPNHIHLMVQGHVKNAPKEEAVLNKWLSELVELVRMKVVIGPNSKYVSEPGNEGITGCVGLATSHAAIHIWDAENPAFFQFDLYSCTEFTKEEVINYINETMGLVNYTTKFLDRNNFRFTEK